MSTVPRVFQSFFGQTFTNKRFRIVQSILLCSFEVGMSAVVPPAFGVGGLVGADMSGFGARCLKVRRDGTSSAAGLQWIV